MADGVGSSDRGAEAAALGVACLVGALDTFDPPPPEGAPEILLGAVDDVFSGAVTAFLRRSPAPDARNKAAVFSTTLALVVLHGPWLVFAGVGDSFVVVVDRSGVTHLLVPPRAPGTARNETRSLSLTAQPSFRVVFDPELAGVLLCTDGLEAFIDERIVVAPGGPQPVPWRAAPETFGNVVADLRGGVSTESLVETFGGPAFQSRKGDDIGLAIAFR